MSIFLTTALGASTASRLRIVSWRMVACLMMLGAIYVCQKIEAHWEIGIEEGRAKVWDSLTL